jgi:hypothetical protein
MKTYFSVPVIAQFVKILFTLTLILVGVKLVVGIAHSGELKLSGVATNFMYWMLVPLALLITFWHVRALKKLGIEQVSNKHLKLEQHQIFKSNLQKAELISRLMQDSFFRIMKISETENGIILRSGASWRSWGESITVVIQPVNTGEYNLEVMSKPSLFTTLFDQGKNLENVVRLEKVVR